MLRRHFIHLALVLSAAAGLERAAEAWQEESPLPPLRALRVPARLLQSPEGVPAVVDEARRLGFTALFVQVRELGEAYYRSSLEPRATPLHLSPGYDPLGAVVSAAHDAGLQVHAWLPLTELADSTSLPSARGHALYTHPEWLMVPRAIAAELRRLDPRSPEYLGRLTRWIRATPGAPTRLYVSPGSPEASAHIAALAREVVSRYEIEGLHLDATGFPDADADYSLASTEAFRRDLQRSLSAADRLRLDEEHTVSPAAYPQHAPEAWDAFRRARVTGLLMRIRSIVRAQRPTLLLSAATRGTAAVTFEDPRSWSELSIVDAVALPLLPASTGQPSPRIPPLPGTALVWPIIDLAQTPSEALPALLRHVPPVDAAIILDGAAALAGDDADTLTRQQRIRDAFRGGGGR